MALWEVFDGKDTLGPLTDDAVVGMIHKAPGSRILIRREGDEEWKGVAIYAPFALAAEKAGAVQLPPHARKTRLSLAGGVTLFVALFAANTLWFGIGAPVDASCSVRGFGEVSCLFTNHGILPGSGCVVVRARRLSDNRALISQRVCSGLLLPRGTHWIEHSGEFPQNPAVFCNDGPPGSSWTDQCRIDELPAP